MRILDAILLKHRALAIRIIVLYQLDALAREIGLEMVERENGTRQLMNHPSYHRFDRRVRQSESGRLIG